MPSRILLLLHVLRVCHLLLLLGGDIMRRHASRVARHVGGLGWELGVVDIFGRIDCRFTIDAVLVAGAGFGRV